MFRKRRKNGNKGDQENFSEGRREDLGATGIDLKQLWDPGNIPCSLDNIFEHGIALVSNNGTKIPLYGTVFCKTKNLQPRSNPSPGPQISFSA